VIRDFLIATLAQNGSPKKGMNHFESFSGSLRLDIA
jgi:hypothetical protein